MGVYMAMYLDSFHLCTITCNFFILSILHTCDRRVPNCHLHAQGAMNFARHSITETKPVHVFDARFDSDCKIFTTSTPAGFAVYRAWPLTLLRKRGPYSLSCLTLPKA